MLRLTVIPPKLAAPGSFSTMKHVMPSSVRAASATSPARWPFVTHVFVPVITYSSPSRAALHVSALVSVPASGSESESAPRISPAASRGNHWRRCSSVPLSFSRFAAITWVFRTPDNDIQPAASSSMTPQYVGRSSPSPPYSSGIVTPNSPRSRMVATSASGYSSACSMSDATGNTSRSTKRRTVAIISSRIAASITGS